MKIYPKVKLSSLVIAFLILIFTVISTHQLNAVTTPNVAAPNTTTSQDLIIAQKSVGCTITDPTGTPLNLRDFPSSENSGINATLPNGTSTSLYGLSLDNQWAFVSSRTISGWAWKAYLNCPSL